MTTGINLAPQDNPADATPLLRPPQIEERIEERGRLQTQLAPGLPRHLQPQNRGLLRKQLMAVEESLKNFTPRTYAPGDDLDAAVVEERNLRNEIVGEMPTKDEMMRNPAGSVDRHMRWEKKHKNSIMRWKHLRLRLHASDVDFGLDRDVANLEVYRPEGGSGELPMHGTTVSRSKDYHFGSGTGTEVVFRDDEIAAIADIAPEVVDRLAIMSNFERQQIRNILDGKPPMDGLDLPASAPEEPPYPAPEAEAAEPEPAQPAFAELRAEAKALGINSFGKGRSELEAEIRAAGKVEEE
jgi:hypothetical protein|tara:strand:+ start:10700 stop:11590 length:891 start_codon:yes stop_codon:yes gene_type:complete